MHRFFKILTLSVLATSPLLRAEIKPDALFSDHAVLQQGVEVPVWGTASPGEEITIEIAGQKVSTVTPDHGRWMVRLKPMQAGGPYSLLLKGSNTISANDILVGEVWLCSGQSNMARTLFPPVQVQPRRPYWEEAVLKADYPQIRHFLARGGAMDEPAGESSGEWKVCTPEAAREFTAVGYFFARDLTEARKVPVGLINASVGATGGASWVSRETLESDPKLKAILDRQEKNKQEYQALLEKYQAEEPKLLAAYETAFKEADRSGAKPPAKPSPPRNPFTDAYRPTGYYNSRIAPLQPFAIKGALWYQGESNRGHAAEYRILLSALISKWREAWKQGDFTFLIVQLPSHKATPPEFREVQWQVSQAVPQTGIVVTTDCGDAEDIHPPDKEPVGARLALMARGLAYGEAIEYSGPEFEALKVEGDRAVMSFKHAAGLMAKGDQLKGFTLAGADKKFFPAQAKIEGNAVVAVSPDVPVPVHARFAWENVTDVNLFNAAGLPALPFRTGP